MARVSAIQLVDGYLHVRFEGVAKRLSTGFERTLDTHRIAVVEACRQHNCRKVLLDLTAIEGGIGLLEEHLAACIIIKEWPPGALVAFVPSPGYFLDKGEHMAKVTRNRGAPIRLFESVAAAKAWLTGHPAAAGVPA